mmetsp:Transcript_36717/g.87893  ORF Transcript_36717/g.87893 Transcript_36717/m.87893 type:complete len:479 (+) Transcript_36717:650-2086(+)
MAARSALRRPASRPELRSPSNPWPEVGPASGQPPEGAFRFAELSDVLTRGLEVTLRFKTPDGDRECESDSLVLRAETETSAQRWGAAVRSAMAAKLVASLPSNWDVDAIATSRCFVSKQSLSQEITSVIQRLVDHCFVCKSTRDRKRREMPLRLQVTEVVRVENSVAWIAYDAARTRLRERQQLRGPDEATEVETPALTAALFDEELCGVLGTLQEDVQEHLLFHGTTAAAVQGISDSRFRLDLAGSHRGTMYGNGVYLAECSSKADEYAEAGRDGTCRMLLCRAALGRVLRNCDRSPKGQELEEQVRSGYDSLCGDREAAVGTFREFVLYDSSQVYPAFIVHYRRVMQPEFLRHIVEGRAWPGNEVIIHAAKLAEEHPDSVVRYRILLLLGNSAGQVVPALISYLGDGRSTCRRAAAGVLRQLATSLAPTDVSSEAIGATCMSAAVPALLRASQKDGDPAVREFAAAALKEIKKYPT